MTGFSGFALLAAEPTVDHEELALALAADLGVRMTPVAVARRDALVRALPEPGDACQELEGVRHLLTDRLEASGDGPLLLPQVLLRGFGHPAAVAIAAVAAARRRGLAVDIAGHGLDLYLAHPDVLPYVVDPARPGALVDSRRFDDGVAWRCSHQSVFALLQRVAARAERNGDVAAALAGASMRLALPLGGKLRQAAELEHRRLLARLN